MGQSASVRAAGSPNDRTEASEVSLFWILTVLLRARWTFVIVTAVGLGLSLGYVLLKRPTFTATSSFLPLAQQDPSRAGLASLAGQFGVSLGAAPGGAQSPQLYADLLMTREVLAPIAADSFIVSEESPERVPLARFLRISGDGGPVVLEKTMRMLRERVISANAATRTTGVVTLNVRTRSAVLSLEISDRLLLAVNDFNLTRRQSQAAAERKFVEARLAEARTILRAAEEALQLFQQQNRQLAGSPELALRRQRLQREVELQQQLVIGLAQQYEESRIREVRDTPVITVIEHPALPARADSRSAFSTMFAALIVALLGAVSWVLASEVLRRRHGTGSDPMLEVFANELMAIWRAPTSRSSRRGTSS